MAKHSQSFDSNHFVIEPMAEGVYGALHRPGGWAIANAGIVDLGDGCLVFDSFLTPAAGADLRRAAETLTGGPVRYLINSHYHNDHIWGNQSFDPSTVIISSADTRQLIDSDGKQEYEWYLANAAARLAELQEQLAQAEDQAERDELQFSLLYYQALAASMPTLELRTPNQIFETELVIESADGPVELLTFERAHTGNDTILYLPAKGIIFSADLLFVGCHPFLPDGEVAGLLEALAALKELNAQFLLPGHGPLGSPRDLDTMIQYLHDLQELARQLASDIDLTKGPSFETPPRYSDWDYPPFFQANMRFLVGNFQAEG